MMVWLRKIGKSTCRVFKILDFASSAELYRPITHPYLQTPIRNNIQ